VAVYAMSPHVATNCHEAAAAAATGEEEQQTNSKDTKTAATHVAMSSPP